MATYPVEYAKHATLTGTTVDTVQVSRWCSSVEISNRSGSGALYVTWRQGVVDPSAVTDPVAAAAGTDVVPVGMVVTLDIPVGPVTVKIVGAGAGGNDYSVVGRGN